LRRIVALGRVTQGFFQSAFETGTFAHYDPGQARFRTFVRVCLDRFIAQLELRLPTFSRAWILDARQE
jgi:hypothetical protein